MSEIELVERVTTNASGEYRFKPTVIEADRYGGTRYLVAVTDEDHASFSQRVMSSHLRKQRIDATLHNQPATLIGYVKGPDGKAVVGARVFLPGGFNQEPIVGLRSATTDDKGVFRITDMEPWRPENLGQKTMNLLIDHPDFARTSTMFQSVPQVLKVQLAVPAIVKGRVIDAVTNQPVADTVVSAQGIAVSGWFETHTDANGKFELRMTAGRYNIWAEQDQRIAVAAEGVKATPGKTVEDVEVKLVRGAFVYGNVIGVGKGEESADDLWVAHYGAARPRSGAAVTSTKVNADGTYRLRVAPGKNYLYLMGGGGSITVNVKDGEELKAHIVPGQRIDLVDVESKKLAAMALREKRIREAKDDRELTRDRGDTKVAKLLDELETLNQREFAYSEAWLKTLRDLAACGSDAVPELIAELDATNDNMMFRCMGFVLRAIDDRRAVPALVRAIPRVYVTHGSDMGLRSDNAELAAFAQKHDLKEADQANRYGFGRPVREVFGAIHSLTGHDFDDSQIFSIRDTGTRGQRELKRELVQRHAAKWAKWWEANAAKLKVPKQYQQVNLPPVQPAKIVPVELGIDYQTTANRSNSMLEPVQGAKAFMSFVDLDTGRRCSLPARWKQIDEDNLPLDEIAAWARGEGFDLMGTKFAIDDQKQCFAIRLLGAKAIQLPADHWKKRFKRVRLEDLAELGTPNPSDFLFRHEDDEIDPLGHATFFIVTAEETPVLFFLGIEVNDDSLKPGGIANGDNELDPVAFRKGRRFAMSLFEPVQ